MVPVDKWPTGSIEALGSSGPGRRTYASPGRTARLLCNQRSQRCYARAVRCVTAAIRSARPAAAVAGLDQSRSLKDVRRTMEALPMCGAA